jgi:RHS repeat-associated protein
MDGNGTPRTVNESAYGNPWAFGGRRLDGETGLMYFRNRMYETGLGRFVSRDPIGYRSGDLNIYQYCLSGPSFYSDPLGLMPKECAVYIFLGHSGWVQTQLEEFKGKNLKCVKLGAYSCANDKDVPMNEAIAEEFEGMGVPGMPAANQLTQMPDLMNEKSWDSGNFDRFGAASNNIPCPPGVPLDLFQDMSAAEKAGALFGSMLRASESAAKKLCCCSHAQGTNSPCQRIAIRFRFDNDQQHKNLVVAVLAGDRSIAGLTNDKVRGNAVNAALMNSKYKTNLSHVVNSHNQKKEQRLEFGYKCPSSGTTSGGSTGSATKGGE